jgi:hypothetical protein
MNKKRNKILIQAIAWFLILLIPMASTYNAIRSIKVFDDFMFYMPLFSTSLLFIVIFYVNLNYLIPRFLFKKRIKVYILLCLLCVVIAFMLPPLILAVTNHPFGDPLEKDPIFQIIRPIVFANILLLFVLSFATSIGFSINDRLQQAEEEKLSSRLLFLKTQIHPHFLFNILNSIYSYTIIKAPDAADMVDKLATMMRYTLKETQQDYVDLDKELLFIENYIALQKVRYKDAVSISYESENISHHDQIAPLILMPFIENAFKHGVNAEEDSRISISIFKHPTHLELLVINNKVSVLQPEDEKSGIGIENTRSRLDMLYPERYTLDITDSNNTYQVHLKLKLI